eukprot:TRINITY_DN4069_c0_g2_i1.p1 TRINITY_DN4069_c0_g2~~TRINITY_DN4069_c0_g2_i1.p1  ORF type:complete len:493 (-),score=95.54 TRINITY_DN4069_c0_g2_i1:34-1512(-)
MLKITEGASFVSQIHRKPVAVSRFHFGNGAKPRHTEDLSSTLPVLKIFSNSTAKQSYLQERAVPKRLIQSKSSNINATSKEVEIVPSKLSKQEHFSSTAKPSISFSTVFQSLQSLSKIADEHYSRADDANSTPGPRPFSKKELLFAFSLLGLLFPSSSDNESDQRKRTSFPETVRSSSSSTSISTMRKLRGVIFSKLSLGILGSIASMMLTMLLGFMYFHRRRIYFPSKKVFATPADYGLSVYEDVDLTTRDGLKIYGWFIKRREQSHEAPTILYLHGTLYSDGDGENMSHHLENVSQLIQALDCNVFMLDYRGYGKSQGYPTEKGVSSDAQAALDFLNARRDIDRRKIFIYGVGLGGAVAINLLRDNPEKVRGLIVENTFTSVADVMKVLYPSYFRLSFLVRDKWQNAEKLKSTVGDFPALFVSGQATLATRSMMEDLFEVCKSSKKEIARIPNGDHKDTWIQKDYLEHLKSFFERALKTERAESAMESTS